MSNPTQLVQKLGNYCSILQDDGLSYGDYVEQLTYLLFLKMADEQSKTKPSGVSTGKIGASLCREKENLKLVPKTYLGVF